MKHSLLISILLLGLCACSSSSKKVDKMTKTYEPVLEQDAQVERITTMIRTDKKLTDEKKDKLVELVHEQSQKSIELRKKQSQLRAVLVDQLLKSSDGSNSASVSTSKELEKLNQANIKGLNDFILKFKSISGERDINQNDYMRELGSVHLI
jgi:apolipoprotein N-acyltransferase